MPPSVRATQGKNVLADAIRGLVNVRLNEADAEDTGPSGWGLGAQSLIYLMSALQRDLAAQRDPRSA
jgi:hypothetical protein